MCLTWALVFHRYGFPDVDALNQVSMEQYVLPVLVPTGRNGKCHQAHLAARHVVPD